jgi:DNA-binding MarR family transcriptional regulator
LPSRDGDLADLDLAALLCHVLLAFTMDFESESRLSLALSANALRVLDEAGVRVRDVPLLTGISKKAVSVSLGFLERVDCAIIAPDPTASRIKVARLTPKGRAAQAKYRRVLAQTDERWVTRYGRADVHRLRSALTDVLTGKAGDHSKLAEGLRPYDDGWRAHPPYANLTKAMLADPLAVLAHYPMVSHRGGFPDGS